MPRDIRSSSEGNAHDGQHAHIRRRQPARDGGMRSTTRTDRTDAQLPAAGSLSAYGGISQSPPITQYDRVCHGTSEGAPRATRTTATKVMGETDQSGGETGQSGGETDRSGGETDRSRRERADGFNQSNGRD